MSAGKPRLLDVTLWSAASGNGPKCWNKGAAMFVDSNRVQPDVDMLAETSVMKAEREEGEISRERSETNSCRDPVRPDSIPYGHTFNGAGVVKSAPLH